MIPILFPSAAFLAVFLVTLRSLGLGFAALFAVGYFNGYIRANYLSVFTTFTFDAGVLGLYLGFLIGYPRQLQQAISGTAATWVLTLMLWPTVLALLPINDFLVQLVALRATIWFVPALLIATQLRTADVNLLVRGLAVLNLMALGGGMYVYFYGLEVLYPRNAVTEIMYRSKDVGGYQYHRIPSFFLNAHAYGVTMLFTLTLLGERCLGRGVPLGDRMVASAGIAAALVGILLCAARQPVVQLVLALMVAWLFTRLNLTVGLIACLLLTLGALLVSSNERFQRFRTLEDTTYVTQRVHASANASFFELMVRYPLGAGLGSSVGTSIPFFLADRAPEQIGLENEYSRILVDQGLIGLGLWIGFVVWLILRPPPLRLQWSWGLGIMLMYAWVAVNWATAFIGAGTLSSIPQSILLLVQMGVLCRVRQLYSHSSQ
jgi:hypothetical protein